MTNHLIKWRDAEELTQAQAAIRFGVNQPTVAKWEKGKVPSEQCLRVHEITGIPLHSLRPDIYPKPKPESHLPEVA